MLHGLGGEYNHTPRGDCLEPTPLPATYTFSVHQRGGIILVLLTFTIGIINLCLGYALAVFLGYGPPSLVDGWDAIWGEVLPEEGDPLSEPTHAAGPPFPMQPAGSPATQPVGEDSSLESEMSPRVVPRGNRRPAMLNEKYVEASILKFNVATADSEAATMEIENRLRSKEEGFEAATIEACLAELVKDSENYLAEQGRLAEQFRQRMGELGDMASVGEEVEMANLAAAAQLETTISNLKHMDFHSDLSAAKDRLLEELGNLRAARHHLRDSQDVAFLAVARRYDRLGQLDPRIGRDPLTGLPNRIGLEIALEPVAASGATPRPPNRRHPPGHRRLRQAQRQVWAAVGDRVLTGLTGVLRELCGPGRLLARYAGQRFAVVMLDAGPSALRKTAELLRQSIERTVLTGRREVFRHRRRGHRGAGVGRHGRDAACPGRTRLATREAIRLNRTCFAAGPEAASKRGITRPAGRASRNPALTPSTSPLKKAAFALWAPCPGSSWACFPANSHAHASVSMAPATFSTG